jgi:7,8-dihydro-6-hydroxymethylpterin-pyrophosphokinase
MTTCDRQAGTDAAAPRLFERAFVLVPLAEIAPDRSSRDAVVVGGAGALSDRVLSGCPTSS